MNKKFMTVPFELKEANEVSRDSMKYGIIKGLASTYGNIDRGNDRVMAGAFDKTIKTYKDKNRKMRMFFQHDLMSPIGAFDVFKSVDNGLYVEGQINLLTQKGEESYYLAKQGVLTDFSIGYYIRDYKEVEEIASYDDNGTPLKKTVTELLELEIAEISLVTNPMNEEAIVTDIKSLEKISDISKALKAKGFSNSEANDIIYKIKQDVKARDEHKTNSATDAVDRVLFEMKLNELVKEIKRRT